MISNGSIVGDIDINQLKEMGFSNEMIQKAIEKSNKEKRSVLNILLENHQNIQMKESTKQKFEPLNPEQRKRINNLPVGLKNVGNTCYFNSLIQSYYFNPRFVKEILTFNTEKECFYQIDQTPKSNITRLKAAINFIKQLQKLFSLMTLSEKKYIDPSDVLNALVDDYGNQIRIGDEQDVSELNLQILALIDEGLSYEQKMIQKSKQTVIFANKIDPQNQIIEIEEDDYNIMSSLRLLKNTKYFDTNDFPKIYFGKMQESISFMENNKEVKNNEEIIMGPIILDVSHKDLYSSWENFCQTTIDDFKLSNGIISKAYKTYWIMKEPETLCFQLQRVGYHKEKGLEKLNNIFTFDKEIFIDRFLLENSKIFYANQNQINTLKSKILKTNEIIENMLNYQNSNLNMSKIVDLTLNMMNTRFDIDGINYKKDTSMDLLDDVAFITENNIDNIDEKEIQTASKILTNFKNDLKKKYNELKNDLIKYQKDYDNIYTNMKNHRYLLTAILMHEGKAESGHYYSYIFDHKKNIWRKFNDINVIEELNEEKLLKEAYGLDNKSAYFLVYLSDKHAIYNKEPEFSDILGLGQTQSNNSLTPKDKYDYSQWISHNLKKEVTRDNMEFQKELNEYQFVSVAYQIIDNYQDRFTFVNEYVRKYKDKNKTNQNNNCILNFGVFLKNDDSLPENQYKVHLLDCSIRECTANRLTLHELERENVLAEKLKEVFSSMNSFKSPSKIILSQSEISKLEHKFSEYIFQVQNREFVIIILSLANAENFEETIQLISDLYPNLSPQLYFSKILIHLTRMSCLKLVHLLIINCENQNSGSIMNILKYLCLYTKILDNHDAIFILTLNFLLELITKYKTQSIAENINKFYNMIKNKNFPKEWEKKSDNILKKTEEIQNLIIEKYQYLWDIKEKEDFKEIQLSNLIMEIFRKCKNYFDVVNIVLDKRKNLQIAVFKELLGNNN